MGARASSLAAGNAAVKLVSPPPPVAHLPACVGLLDGSVSVEDLPVLMLPTCRDALESAGAACLKQHKAVHARHRASLDSAADVGRLFTACLGGSGKLSHAQVPLQLARHFRPDAGPASPLLLFTLADVGRHDLVVAADALVRFVGPAESDVRTAAILQWAGVSDAARVSASRKFHSMVATLADPKRAREQTTAEEVAFLRSPAGIRHAARVLEGLQCQRDGMDEERLDKIFRLVIMLPLICWCVYLLVSAWSERVGQDR